MIGSPFLAGSDFPSFIFLSLPVPRTQQPHKNNTGNATIFVTSYRSEASDGEENDDEDETRQHSVRLELRDTTFENEDMATAVVHGDGAYVSMRGCAFEFGGPSGPALNVIGGGTLRLENTRFYNNGEAEEGDEDGTAPRYDEVVLGPDSVLHGNSGGNCAFGTPDSGCSGVMFSGGECDTFGEACSTPAPTDGPTFAPTAVPSVSFCSDMWDCYRERPSPGVSHVRFLKLSFSFSNWSSGLPVEHAKRVRAAV